MSDQDETPKRSLKDRLMPHLPTASISFAAGMLVVLLLRPGSTSIQNVAVPDEWGTVLLGRKLVEQVVQQGEAHFEMLPGLFVDIIDWGNPNVTER